jgi:copper chaperone CopZ
MASRVKEGIRELFSSKDDLDYPNTYLNRNRGFQSLNGLNTKLPVLELTVPMCCEKCEEKVKEELEELDGVRDVICDQYNQRVTVTGFVDPLKALRKVKKVKKKSAFFDNSTYINAASLPIESARNNNALASANGFSESRYTTNPLVRANSSGFGRFPHEGHMSPMMRSPVMEAPIRQAPLMQAPLMRSPVMEAPIRQAPLMQTAPQQLRRVNSFDRRMNRQPSFGRAQGYDGRQGNAFAPVDLEREYYGVRRMPSFKNHRYHDAEYISTGNEFQPGMTETHYVPHHNQRPALLRPQVSFSRVPVTNPNYMKHMESEYF